MIELEKDKNEIIAQILIADIWYGWATFFMETKVGISCIAWGLFLFLILSLIYIYL